MIMSNMSFLDRTIPALRTASLGNLWTEQPVGTWNYATLPRSFHYWSSTFEKCGSLWFQATYSEAFLLHLDKGQAETCPPVFASQPSSFQPHSGWCRSNILQTWNHKLVCSKLKKGDHVWMQLGSCPITTEPMINIPLACPQQSSRMDTT